MSETIRLDQPVWTKEGERVTDLASHDNEPWVLRSHIQNRSWTAEGVWRSDMVPSEIDLTNTPPAQPESQQPDELTYLRAENKRLTKLVSHLENEVDRRAEQYRVLWNIHTKTERRTG